MAISLERCGAVILCGGQSRRMGTCKARLTVEGEPVLHRLAGALSFFEERLLSANDASLGAGLSWTVVEDRFPGLGPGAGLHAALLASKKEALLCVPCDLPAFSEQAARCLLAQFPGDCAAMVCRDGTGQLHPLCGIYTKQMLPVLERRLSAGHCRMTELLEDAPTTVLDTAGLLPDGVFFNMNTPADHCRAEEMIRIENEYGRAGL